VTDSFNRDLAHTFLTAIYDDQPGYLQICSTGNWAGRCFPTDQAGITAAVKYAADLDAVQQPSGIYFRTTTLRAEPPRGQRGGADDTAHVPFLFSDIDFGAEGHKGTTLPPSEDDARKLVAEAGLPEPTLWIHSGGGWYALWRPSTPLDPPRAEMLLRGVQEVLEYASADHGWSYGTGVGELARVLRLPGSVNRKTNNPRACRVDGGTGKTVAVSLLPEPRPGRGRPGHHAATSGAVNPPPEQHPYDPNRGRGPLDALAENTDWMDILGPAGWMRVGEDRDGERWLRPGDPSSDYSARVLRVNPHVLVVHSEATDLPSGAHQRLTKGRVFAYLWHRGDVSEAARDLVRAAHGSDCTPAARALPQAALGAVAALPNPLHGLTTLTVRSDEGSARPMPILPSEFWSARPVHQHIRKAAHSRLASADLVFHAALAKIAAMRSHELWFESGRGRSSLNYFVAVVGPSGIGKTSGAAVVDDVVLTPAYLSIPLETLLANSIRQRVRVRGG
jgi:hypothetical protein